MIQNKRIEKCFANHVATIKQLDKDTQVLTWKKLGTRCYEIDYVFYRNMIFITGDLRDAVFNCTWSPRWDTDWTAMELGYFAEKMTAHEDGKYIWDYNYAIENLKEHYSEYFTELSESQFADMTEYLIEEINYYPFILDADNEDEEIPYIKVIENRNLLLQYRVVLYHALCAESESEFAYNLRNDSHFNDFNDFWDWGYKCGRKLNSDIEYYLMGLQMAYKQLMERNYK